MVFRSHPEWTVVEPIKNIGKGAYDIFYLVCLVLHLYAYQFYFCFERLEIP